MDATNGVGTGSQSDPQSSTPYEPQPPAAPNVSITGKRINL